MSIAHRRPSANGHTGEDSMGSSPEAEHNMASGMTPASVNNGGGPLGQDAPQPKRKGGRKPIYATSEERKQRNRQAQAAFRERRTEYIKQLEERISIHENNLQSLQAAHRNAADECLMLRYKNSLLERILLEKGIDVQAELRAKTGSPSLGPTHMPQNIVQPPPLQRTMMSRHGHARRPGSIAAKMEANSLNALPPPLHGMGNGTMASPRNVRPPPSSNHSNSPSASGNGFGGNNGLSPVGSDMMSRASAKNHMSPMHSIPGQNHMNQAVQSAHSHGRPAHTSSYYPTPGFQNHIEQLEQEYDSQNNMVDDSDMDRPTNTPTAQYGAFSNGANMMPSPASTRGSGAPNHDSMQSHHTNNVHQNHNQSRVQQQSVQQQSVQQPVQQTSHQGAQGQQPNGQVANAGQQGAGGQFPSMTQLLDSGMEWDPFGLSASMAFPTPFTFDQSNMR